MLALCKAGKAKPLSACLQSVGLAEGRRRLTEHLKSLPYPHYEPAPGGLLVRIEATGKRTSVEPYSCQGVDTLRSSADSVTGNNLDHLRPCDWKR